MVADILTKFCADWFTFVDARVSRVLTKHDGHDGPVSLHWLNNKIHTYQTLLGQLVLNIRPQRQLKLVAPILLGCKKKISKDFTT